MINQRFIYFLILFVIMTLGVQGCGGKRIQRDGPPKYVPNLDKIPDAKPVAEPLSRYGNRFKNKSNVYTEKNRRYKVMPTSKGYKAKGTASWYGTLFHGRRTSSGEPYDMYGMTAAHPTLPLPTYAKVTNLKNGKSVIVKINDRGPFRCNRLIDLSYVAAAKLGIVGHGTGYVEVQSVDPRDHGHNTLKLLAKNNTPEKGQALTQIKKEPLQVKKESLLAKKEPLSKAQVSKVSPKPLYLQFEGVGNKSKALEWVKKIEKLSTVPTTITEVLESKIDSINKKTVAKSERGDKSSRFLIKVGPIKNDDEAVKLTQLLAKGNLPPPTIIGAKQ